MVTNDSSAVNTCDPLVDNDGYTCNDCLRLFCNSSVIVDGQPRPIFTFPVRIILLPCEGGPQNHSVTVIVFRSGQFDDTLVNLTTSKSVNQTVTTMLATFQANYTLTVSVVQLDYGINLEVSMFIVVHTVYSLPTCSMIAL